MTHLLAFGVVDKDTAVFASVLAAFGLVLIVAGYFGLIPTAPSKTSAEDDAGGVPESTIRMVCACIGAVLALVMAGWPVLAGFGAAAGWHIPTLRASKRKRREAIERVDAIATWVETIRDNISGAAGLTQALRRSGASAPEPIRNEVRDLVLRLQHEPVVPTLRRFAADLAHPTADMAIACLILASTRSAGNLSEILAQTAHSARDNATMMRNVEAGRANTQSQSKTVAIVCGVMSIFMILGNGDFVEPYDGTKGQIVLFGICSLASFAAVTMYRLGRPVPQERVFAGVERGLETVAVAASPDELVEA